MSTAFGLDIGSTTIKALSLKKSGNSYEIESLGYGFSTVKGIQSESPEDIKAFTDNLTSILTQANIKKKEVNLSLPDNQVYQKVIEMPLLSEKELAAALKYEMEQYIPLPLDQVKTDWQILNSQNSQSKKIKVLIVAASLNLIIKYEDVLDSLGITTMGIETEIIAVHRALFPLFNSQSTSLIVHMGAVGATIAVIENGELVMVFTIDRGGNALTKAISLDLSIDVKQAESYKRTYGFKTDAFEGKIAKAITPIMDTVISDIKKVILLYKEKNPSQPVSQIILSGGSSHLLGIDTYYTSHLNIQVVFGNSFKLYGVQKVPQEIEAQSLGFNVVSGLTLKE